MMSPANAGADEAAWPSFDDASGTIALRENEIHLWRLSLEVPPEKTHTLEPCLQPDELDRAARFRLPEHRARYVAARGVLRKILGVHTGCAPESLRFSYGEHGKPALAEPAGTRIEFNLSHSGNLALYAVAHGRAVGVDVEFIKPGGSWLRIAEQYFTATEAVELRSLEGDAMRDRFFELWSAKEARLKAFGAGVWFPIEKTGGEAAWPVVRLDPAPEYAAALAYAVSDTSPAIVKHSFVI